MKKIFVRPFESYYLIGACGVLIVTIFLGVCTIDVGASFEDERLVAWRKLLSLSPYAYPPMLRAQHEEEIRRQLSIESIEALSLELRKTYSNYLKKGGILRHFRKLC